MSSKLTPKQEQFCKEYVVDLCGRKAAIRAGFSAKTADSLASQYLKKPLIAARVEELMSDRAKKGAISREWVLERLRQIVERSMQEVAVTDRDGKPTGEWRFDAANAVKALQLLGQHVGLFDERRDETTPPPRALEHFRALLGIRWDDTSRN